MACLKNANPYAHFLLHSPEYNAKQLRNTNLTFYSVALAFWYHTPLIIQRQKWLISGHPQFQAGMKQLRWMIWKDKRFSHIIYDRHFLVERQEWPEEVGAAFGIDSPPTPGEVSAALLVEPREAFWHIRMGTEGRRVCGRAALFWWMMGAQMEAIENIIGAPTDEILEMMANYVKFIMTTPRFCLWALGSNPIPACTDPHMAQAAACIMQGTTFPKRNGHTFNRTKVAFRKLIQHPYIQGQIKGGHRINPIQRPLYNEGLLWPSIEAKEEWIREGGMGTTQVRSAGEALNQYPEQHPKWFSTMPTLPG